MNRAWTMASLDDGYRALVIGASGALGTAFCEQLKQDPRCAGVRELGRHTLPDLDLERPESIASAATELATEAPPPTSTPPTPPPPTSTPPTPPPPTSTPPTPPPPTPPPPTPPLLPSSRRLQRLPSTPSRLRPRRLRPRRRRPWHRFFPPRAGSSASPVLPRASLAL